MNYVQLNTYVKQFKFKILLTVKVTKVTKVSLLRPLMDNRKRILNVNSRVKVIYLNIFYL